ncbi:non-ribosomal peptide synthetase [Haloechinothrix halophila]|uniref:non-ribosomal peptide synthetase n=1 Tax=Haloechinothrix halophila TaxID=1069073 RepID=UPI00040D12D3|nr:non-ribosomal peptide synthetase [Haloechinothrix halophila]
MTDTPAAILADLENSGLAISVVDGNLRIEGRREAMTPELVDRLQAGKPELLEHLAAAEDSFGLTPLQRGYFVGRSGLFDIGDVSNQVYHEIEGVWDLAALQRALETTAAAHPALRLCVLDAERQAVTGTYPRLTVTDLRELDPPERQRKRLVTRERRSHLTLPPAGPLLDAEVTVLADDEMVLHVNHDGMAVDGISMFLLFAEWHRYYSAGGAADGGEGMDFRVHVNAMAALRDTPAYQRSRDYWLSRLHDLLPAPQLPLAKDPGALDGTRVVPRHVRLKADAWSRFQQRVTAAGVSRSVGVLTAWAEVLSLWGAGPRFTVNTTVAQRQPVHPEAFRAIGQFSDPLLLAVNLDRSRTFGERARALQEQLRTDLDHRHYSGIDVMRDLARQHGVGQHTAMPYTFNSTLDALDGVDGSTLERFGPEVFTVSQTPQVYLDVFVLQQHGELVVRLDAVEALYPSGMLDALAGALETLLHRLCDEPAWSEYGFDLLPAEQRERRRAANDTAADRHPAMLTDAFAHHATHDPDAPAVITSRERVGYGDLYRRAGGIASWLREHGIERGDRVGLVLRRGPDQIAGILGTLFAGAAYIPIDPDLPAARQGYYLRDGGARLVVTNAADIDYGIPALDLAEPPPGETPARPVDATPDELAYILYTSGSTGDPKGVAVTHENVTNVVEDCAGRFGIEPADRFFAISAFTFDLSVWDVFGSLSAGAALVLPDADRAADPEHWSELATDAGVTVWNSVPAIVRMLLDQERPLPPSLRLVMMSGDRIPPDLPSALYRQRPNLRVESLGGPTETTIWNVRYSIPPDHPEDEPVPYGRPNGNNRAYIRDGDGRDCPDWVPGEILAAGTGVTPGYWNAPELTAERYIHDKDTGERLYRTGDLGRYLPDGTIDILGRIDFQIKVNGYRIETGEIETRLVATDSVAEAAVVAREGASGTVLVAHLVARDADRVPSLDELRAALRTDLPEYMLPAHAVWHEALPLNRNRKVDRKALAEFPLDTASGEPSTATDPALEAEVAEIWSTALRGIDVDVDADFTALGGDSLTAARILTAVRGRYGVALPVDAIYGLNTVRAMANHIVAVTAGE